MYICTLFMYRVQYNSVTGLILTLCDMNIFAILQSYSISLALYSVPVLFPVLLVRCWKNKNKSVPNFAGIIARLPCYLHSRLCVCVSGVVLNKKWRKKTYITVFLSFLVNAFLLILPFCLFFLFCCCCFLLFDCCCWLLLFWGYCFVFRFSVHNRHRVLTFLSLTAPVSIRFRPRRESSGNQTEG